MASAKEYTTDRIRNVAVLGHGSSGKTTLVDALCFVSGTSKRHGNVDEGTALTMHTPEEHAHEISIQLTPAYAEHMGTKINLLDTPGYLDFTGDAIAATRVADAAIIVVSATSGVEVGTERVWRYCEERGIPRIFFVSMMDKEHADFDGVFQQIKTRLTDRALPVEIPVGEGDDFKGIINLFSEKAHMYRAGTQKGEYDETDIPEELKEKEARWETELQETLATTDEKLLESYLEGGAISREEAIEAMALGMARNEVYPVFCGAATKTYGMRALLKKLVELCPNPSEARPEVVDGTEYVAEDSAPLAALVFKTAAEPHVGELSYFRIFSGKVSNGAEVQNASDQQSEKLNHLSIPMGKERFEVPTLHAGDIGVVAKLKHTHTNDTLCARGAPVSLEKIRFPRADISIAIRGVTRADEDKLGEVLPKLHEEDPTFSASFNPELHQTIARGVGELHLDVQVERMERKYGVKVETEDPPAPPAARRGVRVRRQDQRRCDPGEVRAFRGQGHPGGSRAGRGGGIPAGGLRSRVLRRLLPLRGFVGHRLQAGGLARLPIGGREVPADPPRARGRGRRRDAGRVRGRCHGRPDVTPGEGPGHGAGERAHDRAGPRSGVRALQVRGDASLDPARTGPPHADRRGVRARARSRGPESPGGAGAGGRALTR